MRFPIEVLYLDAAHRVMVVSPVPMDVELDHVPGAHSVVELPTPLHRVMNHRSVPQSVHFTSL